MDDCALLSNVGGTTSHNDTEAKRSGSQTIVLSMSPEKEEEKKNEKKKKKKEAVPQCLQHKEKYHREEMISVMVPLTQRYRRLA